MLDKFVVNSLAKMRVENFMEIYLTLETFFSLIYNVDK